MNVAVKNSDGSVYPIWWIVDVIENVNEAPEGYVLMTIEAYNQYLQDTAVDRFAFILINVDLPKAKAAKKNDIDLTTQSIIDKGFVFSGLTWSLSLTAQINWSNIPLLPETFFPVQLQSQEGTIYQLEYANRMNFYMTAVGSKNAPIQNGHVLKVQIDALATIAEVDNFIDNRI